MGIEWLAIASTISAAIFAFLYVHFGNVGNDMDYTPGNKVFRTIFFFMTLITMLFSFFVMWTVATVSSQVAIADLMVPYFLIMGVLIFLSLMFYSLNSIKNIFGAIQQNKRKPHM